VKRLALAFFALAALFLAACGAAAPPAPARSELEERQTTVALSGRPTLVPLPPGPTPTPAPDVAALLAIADDDPRALGRPDAPVLIVEFTDFE
jgi:protein-disulfide isomerase